MRHSSFEYLLLAQKFALNR
uniref:Uncharacterized protein n=1 Tax=Rhizophora mucronata TaxID=61149 RepID=A0A2P2NJ15_RHIMU